MDDERRATTVALAAGYARRHPRKAAKAIAFCQKALDDASVSDAERERYAALLEGYRVTFRDAKLCIRCGATLKDSTGVGWDDSIGPECFKKEGGTPDGRGSSRIRGRR